MTFRVIKIDHDGFCGREHHPEDKHVGMLVCPVAMMSETYETSEPEGYAIFTTDGSEVKTVPQMVKDAAKAELLDIDEGAPAIFRFWRCLTADGEVVDVMDHEVELHTSGR